MQFNTSVLAVALLVALFPIASAFQPPGLDQLSDLPEPNSKFVNAIPIRNKNETNSFDDQTIKKSAFCETGITGPPDMSLDGVRITEKHGLAFVSDQKIKTNERIEKDELELILAWVSYRVALHNYIVDGKKSEDESNAQQPIEFHKNAFSEKLNKVPCGF